MIKNILLVGCGKIDLHIELLVDEKTIGKYIYTIKVNLTLNYY